MVPFMLQRGTAPLLVSLQHDGVELPEGVAARLTPQALRLPDTDWHVSRLYAFAADITRRIKVEPVRSLLEDFMAAQHGLPQDLRITDLGTAQEAAR